MPRKVIKKFLPEHRTLVESRWLRPFRALLHDPALIVPHRRGVARGFAVGLFWAFMPVPGQSIFAAVCSVWLRVNVVVAMVTTWITNPFTAVPFVLTAHWIGALIIGPHAAPPPETVALGSVDLFSLEALREGWRELRQLGAEFLLGSMVLATVSAALGFAALNWFWLWSVRRRFATRRRAAAPPAPLSQPANRR
jgi:uncharacterized protein (DUF2062 family)